MVKLEVLFAFCGVIMRAFGATSGTFAYNFYGGATAYIIIFIFEERALGLYGICPKDAGKFFLTNWFGGGN